MDLWSGNRSVENEVSTPGLDMFVYSQPWHGESQGGDVHYVSLCAGGLVTRLILADVSGHGAAVADTSRTLRALMRRFMNSKTQSGFIRDLNREFSQLTQAGRFATAIVGTHLSYRNCLTICNAGHPRPLRYQRAGHAWSVVEGETVRTSEASNLPLGLDASTTYRQFEVPVADGDLLVLYTDALIEASDGNGEMLGEHNLMRLVSQTATTGTVREFGHGMLQALRDFCQNCPVEDDLTILVLKFVSGRRRRPNVREKLNAYAKLLRLKSV
jgi:serine phosphatase RsbU (regulator of sigma subunit)